jgi:flagellar protein FliO/FliZ
VESNPGPSGFPDLSVSPANEANQDNGGAAKVAGPAVTVASSLAIVLGLFAGLIWLTRKYGAKSLGQGALPKDVLQSLGSVPIDSRCRITMLRCGSRILVVSQTATGMQPLAEITDPEEVRALTASCLGDSKKMFSSTLESIGREHVRAGFVEPGTAEQPTQRKETPRDRGRLFATA